MARISEYPSAGTVHGNELIPCVQNGVNRNITPAQLIGGYEVKNVLQQITVGTCDGADYSTLNAAIAAIGTIRTFRIVTPITLTSNISIPTGVTIIMGAQGSISGAYTLVGNNTALRFEGQNIAIASNITFTGTWRTGVIDINNFAVVANGVTDDRIVLNKVFDFVRVTDKRRILMNGVYKTSGLLFIHDITIIGNPKFIGTNGEGVLYAMGSLGTFYPLTINADEGDTSFICTNTSFLSSISIGDLIMISTNVEYADECNGAEIIEVVNIEDSTGEIQFKTPLHLDYTVTTGSKVARISPVTFSNEGLITIEYPVDTVGDLTIDRRSTGLRLGYAKYVTVNINTFKTGGWGVSCTACYRPRIVFRGTQGETPGFGYGVSINGATMYADVTGSAFGYRHCIHHGGTTDGVPWESHIHDFYAQGKLVAGATMYDTHPSTGSVTFVNCLAEGDNTYSGGLCGFLINGKNTTLLNCEARYLGVGAECTDHTCKKVSINGLRCTDVNYGFIMSTEATVENLDLRNIRVINSTLMDGAVVYMLMGNMEHLFISDISGFNIKSLFYLSAIPEGTYPTKFELRNFSLINEVDSGTYAIRFNVQGVTDILIDGLVCRKCSYITTITYPVTNIVIRNFDVQECGSINTFTFSQNIGTLMLYNGAVKNPVLANSRIVTFSENIINLMIANVMVCGTNMEYFTSVVSGKTFTNFFHNGNIVIDTITGFHNGQSPTNTITSGSVGIT